MGYLLSTLAIIFYGALLLVWMNPVFAGPYVEIGASVMDGCLTDYDEKRKMQRLSAIIRLGYWQ